MSPRARSVVTSLVLVAILVVAAVVFRQPLIAWFGGKSMGSAGTQVSVRAGAFALKASLDPDPPVAKGNTLVLEVRDQSGKPVDDATIEVSFEMPAMGTMGEMRGGAKVTHESDGRYRAEFDLPMAASWTLRTSVRAGSQSASQAFTLTVGTKGLSAAAGGGAMASAAPAPSSSASAGDVHHYTCSMHPSVKSATPGKCPICGMDLTPVTNEQQEQGVVMIDDARRQLIGVRTAKVVEGPMRAAFRAIGRVTYDEASLTDVNLKVHGWITQLYVNQTGQKIARGQTLFVMYSPELYGAQQDFLLATQGAASFPMFSDAGANRAESLGRAARQRLHLLGMSDAQIDAVAQKSAPMESIGVPSPATGYVIEKNVVAGASVDPGVRLYRIAGLDKVWIEAEVYEADLPRVRVGEPAKVTLDYLPGRAYDAKVAYVYPYLDPKSRTGRVRIEIANKSLELRPGMYVSVDLSADAASRVQVPSAAVVYTGPRRLVFVDIGQGRFRPQEIRVGEESDGMYEVLSGLAPGDLVATSGVFLIAAEARISTAAKYWERSGDSDAGAPEPMPAMSASPTPTAPPMRVLPMPAPKMPSRARSSPAPIAPPSVAPTPSAAPSAMTIYSCPMHPEVQSATPGKCPKCGMDLRPMKRP